MTNYISEYQLNALNSNLQQVAEQIRQLNVTLAPISWQLQSGERELIACTGQLIQALEKHELA